MVATKPKRVRYAVVGMGHIAQIAVLPAFQHARRNSELVALVSGDSEKKAALAGQYAVPVYDYSEYDALVKSGTIEAVYIAVPNSKHHDFSVLAANAGVHVLCEKPLAVTEQECREMIEKARANRVFLMTAYRLHFEQANLTAIQKIRDGEIGEPRFFSSIFSLPVKPGDIRVQEDLGGGSVYDLGIYCINAARYLFRAEPLEVSAFSAMHTDPRFSGVDEMTSAVMRFPENRLATFTSSLGAADTSEYVVAGTTGSLRLNPAYDYSGSLAMEIKQDGKTSRKSFAKRDQFAAELLYFSDCILRNEAPEPSGEEGLIDVAIIQAIYSAARTGSPVKLNLPPKTARPDLTQEITQPPVSKADLVNVSSASGED